MASHALAPAEYADALISASNNLPASVPAILSLLSLFPSASVPLPIYLAMRSPSPERVVPELRKCKGYLKPEWEEIAAGRVKALLHLGKGGDARSRMDLEAEKEELHLAYESFEATLTAFLRILTSLPTSTPSRPYLPILIQILLDLHQLAGLADRVRAGASPSSGPASLQRSQAHLEATARQLNKAFTACVADRNPDMETSRKWATYRIVALLFRTYFKLKSLPLCRNVLRALAAAPLPPLDRFPRADRVTFRYYTGVLHFLSQDYTPAYADLSYAWENCHVGAMRQQETILRALLPVQLLLKGRMPSADLMARFPRVAALYEPFVRSIKPRPSLARFSDSLEDPKLERALVVRGAYLAVEGFRPILLREIIRRLWVVKEKQTRISLADVEKALRFSGWEPSDEDDGSGATEEVEWLVGGLIAKGFVKGYLSHERRMLVLSNNNAFPPLADVGIGATL
ncbi:unnamed protein product [Parajaminaea phylloscopi]